MPWRWILDFGSNAVAEGAKLSQASRKSETSREADANRAAVHADFLATRRKAYLHKANKWAPCEMRQTTEKPLTGD